MAATRVRLTDRGYDPKTAAHAKTADPYLMNQERRPQSEPAADAYESGDPSSWAEDVHQPDTWKEEYAKGRDEIGMGNHLDSTWKDREHPGTPGAGRPQYENKTAAEEALRTAAQERAAELASAKAVAKKALHLAHAMFPQADEKFVMAQARDFMKMPEAALDATIARIIGAGDEEEEEEEGKEASAATAGEIPEQFKKKDEEEEEGKEASLDDLKVQLASIKAQVGNNPTHLTFIASLEDRIAALERAATDDEDEDEDDEEGKEASVDDQLVALAAGLERLAGRKPVVATDDEDADDEEEGKEASTHTATDDEDEDDEEEVEVEVKEASDAADLDIELGTAEMDTTAGEGDLLDDIFLAAETDKNKTASSKPPKKGVSKLGGVGKTASSGDSNLDLSTLWKSDPDVSQDFR